MSQPDEEVPSSPADGCDDSGSGGPVVATDAAESAAADVRSLSRDVVAGALARIKAESPTRGHVSDGSESGEPPQGGDTPAGAPPLPSLDRIDALAREARARASQRAAEAIATAAASPTGSAHANSRPAASASPLSPPADGGGTPASTASRNSSSHPSAREQLWSRGDQSSPASFTSGHRSAPGSGRHTRDPAAQASTPMSASYMSLGIDDSDDAVQQQAKAIQLQLENQSLHSQVVVLTQTLAQLKGDYHRAISEGDQLRTEASETRQAVASAQAGGDATWQARYEVLEAKYRTARHDLLDAQADLRRLAGEYDELAEAAEQDASKVAAGARASEELAQVRVAFSELETQCHKAEEERDVAKSEVAAVMEQINTLASVMMEQEATIQRNEQELASLRARLAAAEGTSGDAASPQHGEFHSPVRVARVARRPSPPPAAAAVRRPRSPPRQRGETPPRGRCGSSRRPPAERVNEATVAAFRRKLRAAAYRSGSSHVGGLFRRLPGRPAAVSFVQFRELIRRDARVLSRDVSEDDLLAVFQIVGGEGCTHMDVRAFVAWSTANDDGIYGYEGSPARPPPPASRRRPRSTSRGPRRARSVSRGSRRGASPPPPPPSQRHGGPGNHQAPPATPIAVQDRRRPDSDDDAGLAPPPPASQEPQEATTPATDGVNAKVANLRRLYANLKHGRGAETAEADRAEILHLDRASDNHEAARLASPDHSPAGAPQPAEPEPKPEQVRRPAGQLWGKAALAVKQVAKLKVGGKRRRKANLATIAKVKRKMRAASYTVGGVDYAKLFHHYDRDNSGSLELDEFQSAIRRDAKISKKEVSDKELAAVFAAVDDDGGGSVDIDEFVAWLESPDDAATTQPSSPAPSTSSRGRNDASSNASGRHRGDSGGSGRPRGNSGASGRHQLRRSDSGTSRGSGSAAPSTPITPPHVETSAASAPSGGGDGGAKPRGLALLRRAAKSVVATTALKSGGKRRRKANLATIAKVKRKMRAASYTVGGVDYAKLFHHYDRDNSGSLELDEFQSAIRRDAKISKKEVSDKELAAVFAAVDDDGGGSVDIDEFVAWLESPDDAATTQPSSPAPSTSSRGRNDAMSNASGRPRGDSGGSGRPRGNSGASGRHQLRRSDSGTSRGSGSAAQSTPITPPHVEKSAASAPSGGGDGGAKPRGLALLRRAAKSVVATTALKSGGKRRRKANLATIAKVKRKMRAASYTVGGVDYAKLFHHYDRDNSGSLELDEFQSAIRRDAKISKKEVSDKELAAVFAAVDDDGGGSVDIDEFVAWLESPDE